MNRRHKKPIPRTNIPRIWMMTDPRIGGGLLRAVQRMPMRSGVIFRHYDLDAIARKALFQKIRRICRRRGHVLLLAGNRAKLGSWQADGWHGSSRNSDRGINSVSVHNVREIAQARRNRADIMLISPVYATRSHPGQPPLGPKQFLRLAALCGTAQRIALGGMTRQRAALFRATQIDGWAAIDAFVSKPRR